MQKQEDGFVRVRMDGVFIYSCYTLPSMSQKDFERTLDRLVDDARDRNPKVIAGDFNVWARKWGSKRTNKKGQALLEALSVLNLVLLNDGKSSTYNKGEANSIIDLTFVSSGLARGDTFWRLTDIYTHSDHRAIMWLLARQHGSKRRPAGRPKNTGWKTSTFDEEVFRLAMENDEIKEESLEKKVEEVMRRVAKACDTTMPRRGSKNSYAPVYWWNDEIAALRRESNYARKLAQRSRGKAVYSELEGEYKVKRARLTKAIKQNKRLAWKELLRDVDRDLWGRPYKVVMAKLKSWPKQQPTCPGQLRNIVATLFPAQRELEYQVQWEDGEVIPPVTHAELLRSCSRMGNKKAPGMDNIPNIALKTAIKAAPDLFLGIYNACLKEGIFPDCWKGQRLVLLPKGGKSSDDPSSYRFLCMLDTAGKILERIIYNRIEAALRAA